MSHDCLWDLYWGLAQQLLANYFLVPTTSNSPRLLSKNDKSPQFLSCF